MPARSWLLHSGAARNVEARCSPSAAQADFTTRTLTNFINLTSFNIQRTSGVYYASMDNINVSAVPEPSTWAMLGLDLMLVAGVLRRKKAA